MGAPALIRTGVGLSILSDVMGGMATKEAAAYNAAQAGEQAKLDRLRSIQQQRMLAEQGGREIAETEVAALKSGVTLDGSPSDAIALSVASLERDKMNLQLGAELAAGASAAQQRLMRKQGKSAMRSLPFKAGSSALTGLALYKGSK